MSSFNWDTDTSGDWNTGTLWTGGVVPNDVAADVTIDAASNLIGYTVTIASGESITVDSLSMNAVNELAGSNNAAGYYAAELELDGTLAFAPGSAGAWDGSLQTYVVTAANTNAEIINGGTLNAFFQVYGDLTLTGTNGVYITSEIQATGGTVTIDTPIAALNGNTLFDGIFDAIGPGSVMDLGGAATAAGPGSIVNIATIEGPQLNPTGWTQLNFADPTSIIDEWNGTSYVSIETSLTEIRAGATIDLTFGRNYTAETSTKTLTIDNLGSSVAPGLLDIEGVTVTAAGGIDLNGGIVQGYGTIASAVVNNGTLIALAGTVSTLEVTGSLTGTGAVVFDLNDQNLDQNGKPTPDATKATLILDSGVSAGQTITMNGGDTLVLATPSAFAGKITAEVGDEIVLKGLTVTSAVLNNGTLVVSDGAKTVASLALGGSYTGDSFTASGSIVTVGTTVGVTTPPGEVILSGSSSQYTIADDGGSLYIQDSVAGRDGTQVLPGVNEMVFTNGVGVFDHTGTAEDVARLYMAALKRAPDVTGLEYWQNAIDNSNVPLSAVANDFTSSPEFIQDYGALSNTAFVQQLYQNVLGRAADAGGLQYWTGVLTSGTSRGDVLLGFSQSEEYKADTLSTGGDVNDAEASRLYVTALNRAPDASGLAFWSAQLSNGATPTQVAQGFVNSAEFQQHYGALSASDFVSALYENVLHRAGDAGGQQYWTNALQQGASAASVVVGFSDSIEDRLQTAGATHANWVFIPSQA